jgi:hypothetical protein
MHVDDMTPEAAAATAVRLERALPHAAPGSARREQLEWDLEDVYALRRALNELDRRIAAAQERPPRS